MQKDPRQPHARRWSARSVAALAVLLAATLAYQLATIRDGILIGTDTSLYLLHARNIVEGRPYGDTGYIVNPRRPDHSPATYPPVVPVLLAPVYAVAGLDLRPYKAEMVLLLVLSCAMVYGLVRSRAGPGAGLLVAGTLGFMPYMTRLKNDILSDIPFLATLYLAFWYADRQLDADLTTRQRLGRGVVAGLLLYVAVATRSPAVFAVPALLLADWWRRRRSVPWLGIAAAVACGALVLVQESFLSDTRSYMNMPAPTGARIERQVAGYLHAARDLWYLVWPVPWRWAGFGLLMLVAVAGWLGRLRRPGIPEFFGPAYLGVIALAPVYAGHRYLVPVLPLTAMWALDGVKEVGRLAGSWRRAVTGVLAVALGVPIAISFLQGNRFLERSRLTDGYDAPPVVEMTDYIRSHTSPDDVILSHMPRTIALLTGRRSILHDRPVADDVHLALIDSLHIRWLVYEPAEPRAAGSLGPLIERHPERFHRAFGNERFEIWAIAPVTEPPS